MLTRPIVTATKRISPERIVRLEPGWVFVFGSNLSGQHGKGAAKTAMKWGAIYGMGSGLQGRTYAIPTVAEHISRTLSIEEIRPHVDRFVKFAMGRSDLIFMVTEIGCGLAGHKVKDIAPLFVDAITVKNIYLPVRFWHKLIG